MITCCRECEQRAPGCHDKCERYREQKAADYAKKLGWKKAAYRDYALDAERIRAIKKIKREGRRHK
jgi:hypothetical protein